MAALSAAPPCMPLKPCQRSLRNAVVPRPTPGCGPTFTIRAWSPGTVIRWESAPVSVATAVICLLSSRGWPNSLVRQDQMDVCPLSRGVMLLVGATPIAESGKRDYFRPLLSEPDVKVSLHPAQAWNNAPGRTCGAPFAGHGFETVRPLA